MYVIIDRGDADVYGFIDAKKVLELELNTKLPSPAFVLEKEDLTRIRKLKGVL